MLYHGLEILAGGAILAGMILGAIGAFIIDEIHGSTGSLPPARC